MGSDDVRRTIPKAVTYSKRIVIPHGVGDVFPAQTKMRDTPQPVAIFLSMTYRSLGSVVDIWRNHILPHPPDARGIILEEPSDRHVDEALALPGVSLQSRFPDPLDLAQFMVRARVHLFPGHRDETFCNAAAESLACGVPLVTNGYGERTVEILSNDTLWQAQHQGALSHPDVRSWDERAKQRSNLFL